MIIVPVAQHIYRRIADSNTSPISRTARREVLVERLEHVLHIDAIALAPEIFEEDSEADADRVAIEGSTEP